ncbi:MAG: DNA translocase FtsK 4TM domain-containing protein, partial [Lachnospiraceae bacterium]|nr:DNA translocase FtsK 4TM domain-containing protein [Lachnospiraceae bacterium]
MAQVRQDNGRRSGNNNASKNNTAKNKRSNSSNKTNNRNNNRNNDNNNVADNDYEQEHTYAETKRELIIWITLIASIVLLLCVFNLCGPLNNVLGAFLFGMFGILAYIFPVMLFFSMGIFLINKTNKRVVRKVIGSWLLYVILAALIQMLVNDKVSNVFDCYMLGCRTKFGGGFIGGCISLSLSGIMGKLAASIILIIICIMLFVFVTGKFIASILVDKSVDRYSEYSAERREERERLRNEDGSERQRRKRSSYFFPRIYNPDKSKDEPSDDEYIENNNSGINNGSNISDDNNAGTDNNVSAGNGTGADNNTGTGNHAGADNNTGTGNNADADNNIST